jgi:hypothetical protein
MRPPIATPCARLPALNALRSERRVMDFLRFDMF